MKRSIIVGAIVLASLPAFAESGKIKVCRRAGITSMMDGKTVEIPAGTYAGGCKPKGYDLACRPIRVKAEGGTLGPAKGACIVLSADLVEPDGKPVKAGEELLTQWSIPGFEPKVTVVSGFK